MRIRVTEHNELLIPVSSPFITSPEIPISAIPQEHTEYCTFRCPHSATKLKGILATRNLSLPPPSDSSISSRFTGRGGSTSRMKSLHFYDGRAL
ncbi:hypothetical protein CDAR_406101 [Caerostris darwini]|uniref:Uncharacterized protein n=1 Tax=Caerostris darwini TaxID=1538125 RepID=A0AAV4RUM7_9ARAC|nr:hypothetical protein CDAR_406101 [Caerostris darwini]